MPGRFIAPPDPLNEYETGCLKVYYPDNPFLFQALMGQLAFLESRFVWDTGGDIAAAEKLAQDWYAAGDMTRASSGDGCDTGNCPDVGDLQTEIIRLTELLREYEDMNITVNCNCCCDGGGDVFYGPGGVIETVPIAINPLDPLNTIPPTFDPDTETPPPGFDNWQSFTDERCRLSNYAFDAAIGTIEALDNLENRSGPILDIVTTLLLFLPTPAGKTGGIIKIIAWVTAFLKFAENFTDDVEELLDYLQIIKDAMVANREDIVCTLYTYGNARNAATVAVQLILNTPPIVLMPAPYKNAVTELVLAIIPDNLYLAFNSAMLQLVPASYDGSYNCDNCILPLAGGFALVPGVPVSWSPLGGTGIASQEGEAENYHFAVSSQSQSDTARTGAHGFKFASLYDGEYRVVGARWRVEPGQGTTGGTMSEWQTDVTRIVGATSGTDSDGYSNLIVRSDSGIRTDFENANPDFAMPIIWTTAIIPASVITQPPGAVFSIKGNHTMPAQALAYARFRLWFLVQEIE